MAFRVWLDTGIFIAAVVPRDANHGRAVRLLADLMDVPSLRTFTSDFVIAETLNYLRARKAPSHIEERFFSVFLRSRHGLVTDLIHISPGRFAHTMARFAKFHDQGLSFTDCSTLVAMDDEHVRTLATFDTGFKGLVDTLGLD